MHGLTLSPESVADVFARAHMNPARRAETLSISEWAQLAGALNVGGYVGSQTKDTRR